MAIGSKNLNDEGDAKARKMCHGVHFIFNVYESRSEPSNQSMLESRRTKPHRRQPRGGIPIAMARISSETRDTKWVTAIENGPVGNKRNYKFNAFG